MQFHGMFSAREDSIVQKPRRQPAELNLSELQTFLLAQKGRRSYQWVADELGISKSAVINICKGDLKTFPTAETVDSIARVFGVPVYEVWRMCGLDCELPDGTKVPTRDEALLLIQRAIDDPEGQDARSFLQDAAHRLLVWSKLVPPNNNQHRRKRD